MIKKFKLPNGIKKNVVKSFLLIVLVSITLLELLLINFIKQYHYKNMEDLLTNQAVTSTEIYSKYFSEEPLDENILEDIDVFWKPTNAKVQIWDKDGRLLMENIEGNSLSEFSEDIRMALNGNKGVWKGSLSDLNTKFKDNDSVFKYGVSKAMSVSYPLKSKNTIVGAIRFITSLDGVNEAVYKIGVVFLIIGLFVIIAASIVSVFLANSIINPIKEVTISAEKMAKGDFNVKSVKQHDDEIGKLSDTLNYMASELLKKEQLKNDFISNVSHELRTPLTSIKGWAITLQYDEIEKSMMNDGLNVIEKECDRLSDMVEELLDFSKFVSGKIVLNKQLVNMEKFMNYLKNYIKPRSEREEIKFSLKVEPGLDDIQIDENRIKQVLINVIDNAFKFTEKGGKVDIYVYPIKDNLIIEVVDTGCGISEEDLPKVKEKFYKGKSSKSKNGIGLSICDEIIRLHNGEFIINSEIDKGTVVTMILPY